MAININTAKTSISSDAFEKEYDYAEYSLGSIVETTENNSSQTWIFLKNQTTTSDCLAHTWSLDGDGQVCAVSLGSLTAGVSGIRVCVNQTPITDGKYAFYLIEGLGRAQVYSDAQTVTAFSSHIIAQNNTYLGPAGNASSGDFKNGTIAIARDNMGTGETTNLLVYLINKSVTL